MGILLPGEVDWSPANWVSRGVFRELAQLELPERLATEVRFCLEAELDTLDLREASDDELRALRQAIETVASKTERAGPIAFQLPEFFPAYVAWLRKLQAMLS